MQALECIFNKNFSNIPGIQANINSVIQICLKNRKEISTDAIASVLMLCYLDLLLALYVLVDALCAGFACAHCEDNGCSAGDCVAACENALASRCAAFVCLNAALTGEGQTLGGVADQGVGAGADGDNDGINVEDPV